MGNVIFKGINSDTISGLIISEQPDITKATRKQEVNEIDGRDGDYYRYKGYDSYDKQIEIGLHGDYDIDEIINYFDGEGEVIFSNEPTKRYEARITKQINYERLIRFRKAKVNFTVHPFKKLVTEANVSGNTSPLSVENKGYIDALPTLIITGTAGQVGEITVNGQTVMTVTIPPEGTITIDGEAENCYNSNADKNQYVVGEFAVFVSGDNTIAWTGGITAVTVIPNSRWL